MRLYDQGFFVHNEEFRQLYKPIIIGCGRRPQIEFRHDRFSRVLSLEMIQEKFISEIKPLIEQRQAMIDEFSEGVGARSVNDDGNSEFQIDENPFAGFDYQ